MDKPEAEWTCIAKAEWIRRNGHASQRRNGQGGMDMHRKGGMEGGMDMHRNANDSRLTEQASIRKSFLGNGSGLRSMSGSADRPTAR
jgi:hypothetical protein